MFRALTGDVEFDVIVIGGGPGGSSCAGLLAKAGHRVLLLEATHFPRYHIGESLIPGATQVLRELGVLEEIDRRGFVIKRGNTYVWGERRDPWSIAFAEAGIAEYSYQVVRAEFDEMLLRHCRRQGVDVREGHRVRKVMFDCYDRAIGVEFIEPDGEARIASARFIVDASGQTSLLGRQLRMRRMDPTLNNVAFWAYYRRAKLLPEPRSGYTLSASVRDGWIWYIPLHDDTVSVGVVAGVESLQSTVVNKTEDLYETRIADSELVSELLRHATRKSPLSSARDWSYRCERFTGPGWILVGDAAGFVDPILSTGCGLALQAGYGAALALDAVLRGGDSATAMRAFERFYDRYIGQFFDFVHYFYDANRHVDSYYWQARKLVDPKRNDAAREAFIYLISGLNHSNTDMPMPRSFQMGVFDNLGTPLGGSLLGCRSS